MSAFTEFASKRGTRPWPAMTPTLLDDVDALLERQASSEPIQVGCFTVTCTMRGVLDLMTREMHLTNDGYDATINDITERMGGGSSSAESGGGGAARIYYDANGNPVKR